MKRFQRFPRFSVKAEKKKEKAEDFSTPYGPLSKTTSDPHKA